MLRVTRLFLTLTGDLKKIADYRQKGRSGGWNDGRLDEWMEYWYKGIRE